MAYKGEWGKGGDPTERGEREIELWLIHAAQNQREQLLVLPALAERRETERKARFLQYNNSISFSPLNFDGTSICI